MGGEYLDFWVPPPSNAPVTAPPPIVAPVVEQKPVDDHVTSVSIRDEPLKSSPPEPPINVIETSEIVPSTQVKQEMESIEPLRQQNLRAKEMIERLTKALQGKELQIQELMKEGQFPKFFTYHYLRKFCVHRGESLCW